DATAAADVAIVVVNDAATEGKDRETLRLPGRQDELVEAVAEASETTVVVVQSSGPVELPWAAEVNAILEAWYPGQADGAALASVLYGDVDAAGRLPVTFGREGDYPTADEGSFPGLDDEASYDEGVFVGYRHFDAAEVTPVYPFGHGLSYATFEYQSVRTTKGNSVRVTVENTGDRDGREVVQAYVRPPDSTPVDRPVRELAGFESVHVPAGGTETVEIPLANLAFDRYDDSRGWVTEDGAYTVEIGRSSRDIELEAALSVEESVAAGE
ncbi:glycoside hydrolase family 3 C-terminal domain-containing protein, partial [Halobium palmae]